MFASTVTLAAISNTFAAEAPTDKVLKLCRAELAAEKRATPVDRWSTMPLPREYQRAAKASLQDVTMNGWFTHENPNQTLTIVIRALDPETKEISFVILLQDKGKGPILKDSVFAFEFALSSRAQNGVTGLFFCSKTGPSEEWNWGGDNWATSK
jgi:hypothetical protein